MALHAGETAEAYVYYRLLSWGYDCDIVSSQNRPFDIILFIELTTGRKVPVRIQVKGTGNIESGKRSYRFNVSKGSKTKTTYDKNDFDILALVAIPEERVYFTDQFSGSVSKRINPNKFTPDFEKKSWSKCIGRWHE